jgi:hypothetical protein
MMKTLIGSPDWNNGNRAAFSKQALLGASAVLRERLPRYDET